MTTTEAEERAIEVMARAMYEVDPTECQERDIDNMPVGKPYTIPWDTADEWDESIREHFTELARAAYAAIRAHDAETLQRVVMDEDGNVEAEKREVRN